MHPARLRRGRRRGGSCRRPGRPTSAARTRRRRARASGASPRTAERRGERDRLDDERRRAHPLAHERRGDSRRHHPPGGCSDRPRPPHWREYMVAGSGALSGSGHALAARARARPRDERADHGAREVGLRVPLHAEHEAPIGWPARHSIASGSSSSVETPLTTQPLPEPVDALVMVGLVACISSPAARPRACPRPAATSCSAPSKEPSTRRCSSWPKCSGRCCSSVPPQRDVDQLHAPADPQHRQVALDRRARERDLERVALGHRVDRLGVRLLAVGGGVDVGAAGEHQPVDQIQRLLRVLGQTRGRAGASAPSPPARCTAST